MHLARTPANAKLEPRALRSATHLARTASKRIAVLAALLSFAAGACTTDTGSLGTAGLDGGNDSRDAIAGASDSGDSRADGGPTTRDAEPTRDAEALPDAGSLGDLIRALNEAECSFYARCLPG